MMHNKVNITRLQKDVEKILVDVEKLKDGQRGLLNGGSSHKWKSQGRTYSKDKKPTKTSSSIRETTQKEK